MVDWGRDPEEVYNEANEIESALDLALQKLGMEE